MVLSKIKKTSFVKPWTRPRPLHFPLSDQSYGLEVADSLRLDWHPCITCLVTLCIAVQVAKYLHCHPLYQYVIVCYCCTKPLEAVLCLVMDCLHGTLYPMMDYLLSNDCMNYCLAHTAGVCWCSTGFHMILLLITTVLSCTLLNFSFFTYLCCTASHLSSSVLFLLI